MIAIGDQYNTLDSCSIEGVSKVLEVMGGLLLFIAILYIMVGLSFCTAVECGTVCAVASCPIVVITGLAQFGVQIWASVVVFGKSLDLKFIFPFKVIVYKSCSELFPRYVNR
jgi:hypothetical protein